MAECKTRRVFWSEIEVRVSKLLSAELCASLSDLLHRNKNCELFITQYPYGQLVVDRGAFHTPCNSEYCPNCTALKKSLHQDPSYTPVPLSLILEGSAEVFMEYPQEDGSPRYAPLQIMRKAEFFGVFESLDRLLHAPTIRPAWSVSSGARSIWIIAPTGDSRLAKELGKLLGTKISWNPDRHAHWKLVEAVVRQRHEWNTEVLVFSMALGDAIKKIQPLFNRLLSLGWTQSTRLRHIAIEDADLRESVHRALKAYSTPQGELFQYVTVRHLLDVAKGGVPDLLYRLEC